MDRTPVTYFVALAFGTRDRFLRLASFTVDGSVTLIGPELHPSSFLWRSASATVKYSAVVGGSLPLIALITLLFFLFLALSPPILFDNGSGCDSRDAYPDLCIRFYISMGSVPLYCLIVLLLLPTFCLRIASTTLSSSSGSMAT